MATWKINSQRQAGERAAWAFACAGGAVAEVVAEEAAELLRVLLHARVPLLELTVLVHVLQVRKVVGRVAHLRCGTGGPCR